MKQIKKIVFVLPDLMPGGAERVMSFVATNISKKHFKVSLWVAGYSKNTKYDVSNIEVVYFNKSRILNAIPDFYLSLRKVKPDIVISTISHVNIVMGFLSIFYPKTKFIGREANVSSIKNQFATKKKFYNILPLSKLSYRYLDIILCQSRDMYNDMKLNHNIPVNKLRIINNPITDDFKLKTKSLDKRGVIHFITVARLKKQKGHERIIQAISKLNFPYQYTIVGDGPEKDNLFDLINELGINDKIKHIPYTSEVSEYLSNSDFFLQGAYVEGFPNCLIESCSVGTPIIAFNAPGGLDEIIEEGINGFIAENEDDFINNILKSTTSIQWSSKEISNSVTKKFNKRKILLQYEKLFDKL
jgi:glycosyltransferase involved in cell wall biosynthesis